MKEVDLSLGTISIGTGQKMELFCKRGNKCVRHISAKQNKQQRRWKKKREGARSGIHHTMTGGHSRADSFSDSRGRTEGRSALPRRRATKMSYSETGGFDTDLALAVQESLRYARQAEREAKEREDGTISNHVGGERSCMMQSKFTDETTDECVMQSCAHLKDLLLVNLDLVQHQQELLTEKEKEIRAVKSENNMVSIDKLLMQKFAI